MLRFIEAPLVIGVIGFSIYKLFELFVCRKERMYILEKIEKFNVDMSENRIPNIVKSYGGISFSALKMGGLLLGLGLGIVLGVISVGSILDTASAYENVTRWNATNITSTLFLGVVLFMGGLGLLSAFVIEYKLKMKNREK